MLTLPSWRKWDPPLDPEDKASQGLGHQGTGFELSTLDVDWNNVEEHTKFVSKGNPLIDEFSLGCFCYPNGAGDKHHPWVNAFWGEHLLKHLRILDGVEKQGAIRLAKKYRVKEITALFITNVVVMVQQTLTSDETLQEVCSGFDYTVFYDKVCQFLEEPKYTVISKNLLKWWNRELLSHYPADIAGSSQAEWCKHGMLAALDNVLAPGGALAGEANAGAGGAGVGAGEADADAGNAGK